MDSNNKEEGRIDSNIHNDAKRPRSLEIQYEKIPELPSDIMADIFSRLPLKILIGYISVSDPSLYHIYLTEKSNYFSTFFLNRSTDVFSLDLVELDKRDVSDEKGNHEIEKVAIFNLERFTGGSCSACNQFSISGYCKGLFCALKFQSGLYSLFVINPFLGECIQLPKVLVYWCKEIISFDYGIGYCELTNRYKVLIIITYDDGDKNFKNECGIFTIGSVEIRRGVWESVNVPCNRTPRNSPMVPFRSALHWVVQPDYNIINMIDPDHTNIINIIDPDRGQRYICAFDMTEEKASTLSVLPLPPEAAQHYIYYNSLGVLSDKLCVWQTFNCNDLDVPVWVMVEYGVASSWTKQFVLRRSSEFGRLLNSSSRPFDLALLAVLPEGVILASLKDKLVLYDMKKARWLMVGGQSKQKRSYLSPFVPSFVSLNNLVQG